MQITTNGRAKANNMNAVSGAEIMRRYCVLWLYASIIVHFLVGLLLPWAADLSIFNTYHQTVETGFWSQAAPAAARAQQVWWISLFGPTVQSVAVWMGALLHIGNRQRSRFAWTWLIIGLLVWAPQDMLISLRASATIHVWIDGFALLAMLPPLCWLCWYDRAARGQPSAFETIPEKL